MQHLACGDRHDTLRVELHDDVMHAFAFFERAADSELLVFSPAAAEARVVLSGFRAWLRGSGSDDFAVCQPIQIVVERLNIRKFRVSAIGLEKRREQIGGAQGDFRNGAGSGWIVEGEYVLESVR